MRVALRLFIVTAFSAVHATDPLGSFDNNYGNETLLCNSSIANANASGLVTFAVEYPTAASIVNATTGATIQNVPDPSWALTVDVEDGTTQTSLWYDTAGQNYSQDLSLGYDVCAYFLNGLPQNTIELGQDDPGDCSSTISSGCRNAILDRAASSAYMWTSYASPPPYSNLSAGVLPTLCGYILADLGDKGYTFPKECARDLGYTYKKGQAAGADIGVTSNALTGLNSSQVESSACSLSDGAKTFRNVNTGISTAANAYDEATRNVFPILTVFLPVANADRTFYQSAANSTMQCLRATSFSEGSRISPALPEGTPYNTGESLSGGTIAGIVIGVVVVILIIVGLVFCFLRRRRQQQRRDVQGKKLADEDDGCEKTYEANGTALAELSPKDREHEADSSTVVELGGCDGKTAELSASDEKRHEMSA